MNIVEGREVNLGDFRLKIDKGLKRNLDYFFILCLILALKRFQAKFPHN